MADEPVTKRLHISGLTPAITAADLTRRLGSYGAVTALDGLGKRDALGKERPYAYATLETTKGKLAKCMNVLSGSVWKGAKLRVGEAKPDFRERITAENSAADTNPRPTKRRRTVGVHAPDMSPMTIERARTQPGWTVTTLGRLIRPVRMRPEHPLDPPLDVANQVAKGKDGKEGKRRRKKVEISTRARRRLIDPLRWGSTHIKGVFLEGQVVGFQQKVTSVEEDKGQESESDASGESDEGDAGEPSPPPARIVLPTSTSPSPSPEPAPQAVASAPTALAASTPASAPATSASDLQTEKRQTLSLLASLFSGDDWGGAEDLSDVDMDAPNVAPRPIGRDEAVDDDFEVVPRAMEPMEAVSMDDAEHLSPIEEVDGAEGSSVEDEEDMDHANNPTASSTRPSPVTSAAATQRNKLAELFAPQEEQAGFSLFGNLDDDLDLDLDLDLGLAPPAIAVVPAAFAPVPIPTQAPVLQPIPDADLKTPLFFPTTTPARGGRTIMSALAEIADPRSFMGTLDEEGRRARWEAQKRELTTTWKKRAREAGKGRRRRGGADV
ncbi:unnamed protein product [Peniophora sp. CBMAI 1063]|nr:unnamed protein product [Peniophora sp. CBMAI 1063]